jgi:hypothetical protein
MSVLREFSAIVVASLVVGIAFGAVNSVPRSEWFVFLPFMVVSTLAALVHAAVLGVPAAFVLRRLGKLRLPQVLCTSFAIGALPISILLVTTGAGWTLQRYAITMLAGGLLGALGGLAWWLVAGASSNKSLERTREG